MGVSGVWWGLEEQHRLHPPSGSALREELGVGRVARLGKQA